MCRYPICVKVIMPLHCRHDFSNVLDPFSARRTHRGHGYATLRRAVSDCQRTQLAQELLKRGKLGGFVAKTQPGHITLVYINAWKATCETSTQNSQSLRHFNTSYFRLAYLISV